MYLLIYSWFVFWYLEIYKIPMREKFFENRKALIVLIAASFVVLVSMGIRQTWGLFYQFFDNDLFSVFIAAIWVEIVIHRTQPP